MEPLRTATGTVPPSPVSFETDVAEGETSRKFSGTLLFWLALCAASVLYWILSLLGAASDPWRVDEAYTWYVAKLSEGERWLWITRDVHPPFYYFVLGYWLRLWHAPIAMKALNLLLGWIAVLLGGLIVKRTAGKSAGAWSALLLASFPMLLHYSQDARMYPLGLVMEMIAVLGWLEAQRNARAGTLLLLAGLTGALYASHHCIFFAAALLGGGFVRAIWTLRYHPFRIESDHTLRPGWVGALMLAQTLLFAPWLPFMWAQAQQPAIEHVFSAPPWNWVWHLIFAYPYTLGKTMTWYWLDMIPGFFLLGLLPLLGWRVARGRTGEPLGLVLWVGAAPLIALILYSKFRSPIVALDRHPILYLPFVLMVSGGWLGETVTAAKPWRRWLATTLFALSGLLALIGMAQARDPDHRTELETVIQRLPPRVPVLTYPASTTSIQLQHDPLEIMPISYESRTPEKLRDAVVVVFLDAGFFREELLNQAQMGMARARSVEPIFESYAVRAYLVRDMAPGGFRELMLRHPGFGREIIAQQLGSWPVARAWTADDLLDCVEPAGQVAVFTPLNTAWRGLRLRNQVSTLKVSRPESTSGFAALAVGGQAMWGAGRLALRLQSGGHQERVFKPESFIFMLCGLVAPQVGAAEWQITIPRGYAKTHFAPEGDVPPGVYLTWGAWVPLLPENFAQPGYGAWFKIGRPGDELFIRSEIHEREGTPGSEVRWTKEILELELPVWHNTAYREVILTGMLPPELSKREIALQVHDGAADPVQSRAETPKAQWGDVMFTLPRPLQPGIAHLKFKFPVWVPAEEGLGMDTRELGFFLGGVGLR